MKKAKISLNNRVIACFHSKLNKILYFTSLLAIAAGIFLLPKTALMTSITPDKLLELTNEERAQAGLVELSVNNKLAQAANEKIKAILENQIFDHSIDGQKFSAWVKKTGYQYSLVGENLAIDFISSESVLKAWLASPTHRENILNDEYTETGIAVLEGKFAGQKTIVVAQIFGAPLSIKPYIPPEISRRHERLSARTNYPEQQKYVSFQWSKTKFSFEQKISRLFY